MTFPGKLWRCYRVFTSVFAVKNLEMKDYYTPSTSLPSVDSLAAMSVAQLRALIKKHGSASDANMAATAVEKHQLIAAAQGVVTRLTGSKYDLVANIVHELNITQV